MKLFITSLPPPLHEFATPLGKYYGTKMATVSITQLWLQSFTN